MHMSAEYMEWGIIAISVVIIAAYLWLILHTIALV